MLVTAVSSIKSGVVWRPDAKEIFAVLDRLLDGPPGSVPADNLLGGRDQIGGDQGEVGASASAEIPHEDQADRGAVQAAPPQTPQVGYQSLGGLAVALRLPRRRRVASTPPVCPLWTPPNTRLPSAAFGCLSGTRIGSRSKKYRDDGVSRNSISYVVDSRSRTDSGIGFVFDHTTVLSPVRTVDPLAE